jgi:hypothetical protein
MMRFGDEYPSMRTGATTLNELNQCVIRMIDDKRFAYTILPFFKRAGLSVNTVL